MTVQTTGFIYYIEFLEIYGLSVVETVVPIGARLIANKVSFKFHGEQIEAICRGLAQQVKQ